MVYGDVSRYWGHIDPPQKFSQFGDDFKTFDVRSRKDLYLMYLYFIYSFGTLQFLTIPLANHHFNPSLLSIIPIPMKCPTR